MPKNNSAFDLQIAGSHYKDFAIQPVIFITKNNLNFYDASIVKYACRHKQKGGAEDLQKIIHYAQMELEEEYGIKSDIQYDENTKSTTSKRVHRVRRKTKPRLSSEV
jgi:hypothetical protein